MSNKNQPLVAEWTKKLAYHKQEANRIEDTLNAMEQGDAANQLLDKIQQVLNERPVEQKEQLNTGHLVVYSRGKKYESEYGALVTIAKCKNTEGFTYIYKAEGEIYFHNTQKNSQIEQYEQITGFNGIKCSVEKCPYQSSVGAHIKLCDFDGLYMIPLCLSHKYMIPKDCRNQMGTVLTEFKNDDKQYMRVKKGTMLIQVATM